MSHLAFAGAMWAVVCFFLGDPASLPLGIPFLLVSVCALGCSAIDHACSVTGHANPRRHAILAALLAGSYAAMPEFGVPISQVFRIALPLALWRAEIDRPAPRLLTTAWPAVALLALPWASWWVDAAMMALCGAVIWTRLSIAPARSASWRVVAIGAALAITGCAGAAASRESLGLVLGGLFFGGLIVYPASRSLRCALEVEALARRESAA